MGRLSLVCCLWALTVRLESEGKTGSGKWGLGLRFETVAAVLVAAEGEPKESLPLSVGAKWRQSMGKRWLRTNKTTTSGFWPCVEQ